MTKKNIVVVGAGYSGIAATKKLAKKFKKNSDISITLIDRHSYQTMMTELHEVAGGRVEPTAIQYDLQRLFCRKKNVQIVTDNVKNIDKEKKVIITDRGEYPFDFVVLGLGGEPNDFGTPGVKEHGFTLWSWEDSVRLRNHIKRTVTLAALEPDAEIRKTMLTFVVCGSGFTGIEMAGELLEWKERLAKDNKITAEEISLLVVEAAPTILNMLDRNDAGKAERYMLKKGIKILKESAIVEVDEDHIKLKSGDVIATHTLIWTAGVEGTSDAQEFGLETGRTNRLVANEYMEAKGFEDKGIYVIGDLTYYEENQDGIPTPQIVQAAEQTGHTAAENIIAEINGTEKHKFKGNYQGFMVSIGSKYGVACLFNKIHLSGFLAIIMKHIVNLKYFFDIRSGYYMFQYLMHEFFHVKDNRNVLRGHSSRYGNVLWSVPLRIFYGLAWLIEGSKKMIGDGEVLKPSTWFGKGSWFTNDLQLNFDWLKDTSTGASEAVEKGVFGLSYADGETPMAVLDHMPKWFAAIMKVLVPNQDVALFMQKFMTIVEIGIALCLIAGLFTWFMNGVTIVFIAMFCLSGMFYWVNIWFIFVAFALMNGSGRAVGLDRWVVPFMQRKLGNWWYGKTNSIYGEK